MIISRIWAGLGNQMFQYAAGKCLAALHQTSFKIDCRWFGLKIPGDTPRRYELDVFNVDAVRALDSEIKSFPFSRIPKLKLGRSFFPRWQLFLQKRSPYSHLRSYRELHFQFDSKFFELPSHVYLVGYFQSERYFKPIEEQIRREFTFKIPPSRENQTLIDQIQNTVSVSLHVRRGDYALDRRVNRYHGLCDLNYYQKAVQELQRKTDRPHFFVFSDDIPWVRTNLPTGKNVEYVTHNQGERSCEDLRLMSHCRHHILANSSFSWWGAWLNPRKDNIVIVPKKWTNVNLNVSDLIPSEWQIL